MIKSLFDFSIITVVYKDIDGLQKTYESIVEQRYNSLEWIIIDGDTGEPFEKFISNCSIQEKKYISEPDNGIYDAMNKGLSLISGKWIIFLNAGDNFSSANILETISDIITKNPADVYLFSANYINKHGRKFIKKPKIVESSIWHSVPANHQATIYNAKILKDKRYASEYKICGDYYLAATLYNAGAVFYKNDTSIVNFYLGGTSSNKNLKLFIEAIRIQKNTLLLSYPKILLSTTKRVLSLVAVKIFGVLS